MEITFFNIEEYEDELKQTMNIFFKKEKKQVHYLSFEHPKKTSLQSTKKDEMNVVFYQMRDAATSRELETNLKKYYKAIKRIAICKSFGQGMQAIENGSCYALLLPFKEQDIEQCCEYIVKEGK